MGAPQIIRIENSDSDERLREKINRNFAAVAQSASGGIAPASIQYLTPIVNGVVDSTLPQIVASEIASTVPGIAYAEINEHVPGMIDLGIQTDVPPMIASAISAIEAGGIEEIGVAIAGASSVTSLSDTDSIPISSGLTLNKISWASLKSLISDHLASLLAHTGDVKYSARSTPPSGWLVCDGSSVSKTTYSALYSVIGDTFGTGTSTEFKLPDLRGRMVAGLHQSHARFDSIGETGGAEVVTLSALQMPEHTHPYGYVDSLTSGGHVQGVPLTAATSRQGTVASDGLIDPSGGGQAHENMPPYVVLLPIIKV